MSWLLHSVVVDCCFLVLMIGLSAIHLAQWRHWSAAIAGAVCLQGVAYWSYALALDAAPDPPTIPCVDGMSLLPRQTCIGQFIIVIPREDTTL